ncbi:MAG: hypothetical protein IKL73_02630 [Lachnospiraceae bacterium]|nr:hypothetical protein [Lachnospira sp.]MBQ8729766.1 hypothetical protein [Lachnospiraceae bacterium]MBR6697149.1 hypothetical protein [Lachnospiraceae bacterium]
MDKFTVYVDILADGLIKKITVLEKILAIDEEQHMLVNATKVDEDAFDKTNVDKAELIKELERLDDGFSTVYDRIKDTFVERKNEVSDKIAQMKENISIITELSVKLQAQEQRTKAAVQSYFSTVKTDIKKVKTGSGVAASYYKTMNSKADTSYFMDAKK